jgi:hypothetical protein
MDSQEYYSEGHSDMDSQGRSQECYSEGHSDMDSQECY